MSDSAFENIAKQGLADNNNTYHDLSNDNYTVNTNALTPQQQQEITQYESNLINSVRQQAGQPLVTPSQTAIDFANNIANICNNTNWNSYNSGHDVSAIEQTAKKFGVLSTGQYYEDVSS